LDSLSFNNLKLKLGPDFKLQFSESIQAYLDTKLDININGEVGNDLRARGLINLEKYFILSLILIFLVATILSLYHLGIEQGFIEESLVCDLKNGSNLLSKEDILRQLQEKNVSCKDVTFKILGLSLTSYNIIISVLFIYFTTKVYLSYDNNK